MHRLSLQTWGKMVIFSVNVVIAARAQEQNAAHRRLRLKERGWHAGPRLNSPTL